MFKLMAGTVLALACSVSHAALQIQSWSLDNGARVLFVQSKSIPILDLSVDFDAGARRDPAGKVGTAAMTNAMLSRGVVASTTAPALNEAQISDAFADLAAQRGNRLDNDRGGLTLRTLTTERQPAVAMLTRLLAQPSFPAELLVRDKVRTIANLKENLTKPEVIAERAFSTALYGTHPYGAQLTEASVNAITRDDLVAFHKQHYVANHAVITMIGDVSRDEADGIARELTAQLPQGAPLPALPAVSVGKGGEQRIAHTSSQAHILIGMPAAQRPDPDFFPLMVGNYVLGGGGFVSRLMNEVREKRGLTYGVSSYFEPMAQPGPFQIGLQTKAEQADQALQVVRETVDGFLKQGPTATELKAAKDNLVGGFSLRIDSNKKLLENIAMIGFYGLPLDYLDTWTANVERVTMAQIRDAFNRKLQTEHFSTIIVGAR
ncbi:M16 family metallopeptidase [Oxalicibacterium faecigallinarum]|uniref:Peptidase M16 n=1 Tax=Oxalicibacterium faecigallinarum TaxID=573741 RepID=A0A8J3AYT6_9BURK|nr:pitrilysin family protein [Oxalicibacterium faecigallinarum]GGI19956.1 peptidase M16 [Oxalicibacterium faecigallinarum]